MAKKSPPNNNKLLLLQAGNKITKTLNTTMTNKLQQLINGVLDRFGCECANYECQRAWIKLLDEHKNTQCGLYGYYDDNISDEWHINELTKDLAQLHLSYALKDKNECTESKQNNFYFKNKRRFRVLNNELMNKKTANKMTKALNNLNNKNIEVMLKKNKSDEEWSRQYNKLRDNEKTKNKNLINVIY